MLNARPNTRNHYLLDKKGDCMCYHEEKGSAEGMGMILLLMFYGFVMLYFGWMCYGVFLGK
jgi:hypothetical protein